MPSSMIQALMSGGPGLPGPSPTTTTYAPNPGVFASQPVMGAPAPVVDPILSAQSFTTPNMTSAPGLGAAASALNATGGMAGLTSDPASPWSFLAGPGAAGVATIPGTKIPATVPYPEDLKSMINSISEGLGNNFFKKSAIPLATRFRDKLSRFPELAAGKSEGALLKLMGEYRTEYTKLMSQKSLNARMFPNGIKATSVKAIQLGGVTFLIGMILSYLKAKTDEKANELKQMAVMERAKLEGMDAEGIAAQQMLPYMLEENQMLLQGISGGQYKPPAEANTKLLQMMLGQVGAGMPLQQP